MPDLTDAIRQFDAAEANLKRLEELWSEIESLIPHGLAIDTSSPEAIRYASHCRIFQHIMKALPKVDGFALADDLMDLDAIFMNRMDAKECGEMSAEINVERLIHAQGDSLREYRFQFAAQRRTLVRNALKTAISDVDAALLELGNKTSETSHSEAIAQDWDRLSHLIDQINVLRGTAIDRPPRWSDLQRHLHFATAHDLQDIISYDWPAAKGALRSALYGADDPVPVEVEDLSSLVNAAPTGPVVTALKWDEIDEEDFERLIFNLISDAPGYSNPLWLTQTRAPDRGRDISATKTLEDALSGSRTLRVIFQCKHWRSQSVGIAEVTKLISQMRLLEPPHVDELVIATSGRFASDAVSLIDCHNYDRKAPLIVTWAESHIESLLAARPHLVAKFGLR